MRPKGIVTCLVKLINDWGTPFRHINQGRPSCSQNRKAGTCQVPMGTTHLIKNAGMCRPLRLGRETSCCTPNSERHKPYAPTFIPS